MRKEKEGWTKREERERKERWGKRERGEGEGN